MSWVEVPADFDPHSLAEAMEAELLISGDDFLSAAELRVLYPAGRQPTETEWELALAEIERRGTEFGSLYPFAVVDDGLMIERRSEANVYLTLLLLSIKGMPVRLEQDYPRSDPIFDEIVRIAFRNDFGNSADSVTFAWPPREGRPSTFPEAVKWTAERVGVPLRGGVIPEEPKDAGVDVIVWQPYPDGRTGFRILLVQNTVQFSFRDKPREVRPSRWRDWLEIGAVPGVGFAVPFLVPEKDRWWDYVTLDVDVVLDRGRLMHALRMEDVSEWPAAPAITAFVDLEVARYRNEYGFGAAVPPRRAKAKKRLPR